MQGFWKKGKITRKKEEKRRGRKKVMARKVYMVDTENVSSSWRMMLADMTRNDVLYLFYTEHSPGIGYADFKEIMESETKPELISCYPGKNGLDFQLVSYLGYLLKSAGKTDYIIISNDMGYDCVIHFWKEQGYKVSRMTVYDLIQRKKARLAQEKAAEAPQKTPRQEREINIASSEISNQVEKDLADKNQNNIELSHKSEIDQVNQNNIELSPLLETAFNENSRKAKKTVSRESPHTIKKAVRCENQYMVRNDFENIEKQVKTKPMEKMAIETTYPAEMDVINQDSHQEVTEQEIENGDGRKLLADLLAAHDVDVDTVIEILRHGSPHQLQKVYTQMLKLFGHQTGVELYHVLKPHFSALFTYVKSDSEHGIDI